MSDKLASFGTYGLHVIQFPSGKYGYVGTVPIELMTEYDGMYGKTYTSKSFITREEAIDYFRNSDAAKAIK